MKILLTLVLLLSTHFASAHYLNVIPPTSFSKYSITIHQNNTFKFFKNRWKPNEHIHVEFGKVESGKIEKSWWSAQWVLEDAGGGFVRIKNRWKNTYLNNESGKLEIGKIESGWWSAQWVIENAGSGYVRIKNRWKGTYLHNEHGKLQLGNIQSGWWSAQWSIE